MLLLMGAGTRESPRDYYREHIRKLIKKDSEALIDLFVDQHLVSESLSNTTQKQQSLIELLEQKIEKLEKRLNEDSHNSHKPPSSDNLYTKPENKTKSTRRKPGGQNGHKGYRLEPTDNPDHTIPIKLEVIYYAEHDEKWAEKLMNCLIDAKNEKDASLVLCEKRILYYKNRVKRIVREGLFLHPKRMKIEKTRGRQKQSKQ